MSQVTVTFTGQVEEVVEAMLQLALRYGGKATSQPTLVVTEPAKAEKSKETEKPKIERVSKPAPEKAAPAVQAAPAPAPPPVVTPVNAITGKTPRQITISELIAGSLKKVPKEKVVELLASFGAKRGGDIKVEDEERFLGSIKLLMA